MKLASIVFAAAAIVPALAFPQYAKRQKTSGSQTVYQAPGPNDARGPCPGLNTLANHNYLPHNGRDITEAILADAMSEGFNIARSDAALLFTQAVRTNENYPLARTFDLDTLGREGVLEHDNSLSRSDRYFGDPLPFNQTVWDETLSYFPGDTITVQQVADARQGRLATSKKTNPEHSLSALGSGFSWGECATFFEILADGTTGTVDKRYIRYWIENERLPTKIGWKRRPTEMPSSERVRYSSMLQEAGGEQAGLAGLSGLGSSRSSGLTTSLGRLFGERRFVH